MDNLALNQDLSYKHDDIDQPCRSEGAEEHRCWIIRLLKITETAELGYKLLSDTIRIQEASPIKVLHQLACTNNARLP